MELIILVYIIQTGFYQFKAIHSKYLKHALSPDWREKNSLDISYFTNIRLCGDCDWKMWQIQINNESKDKTFFTRFLNLI